MVLNDVLMIAVASAGVAAAVQWWVGRSLHRRTVAALKKRHTLAQQETAELLSQCRRQITQLKGELDASAQKARQVRETALKVLSNRPATRPPDELPQATHDWRDTDGFAVTQQQAPSLLGRHGFAPTSVMEHNHPVYGRGFAETVAEELPSLPLGRPRVKPGAMAHYS